MAFDGAALSAGVNEAFHIRIYNLDEQEILLFIYGCSDKTT